MDSRHSTTSKLLKLLTPKHLLPSFLVPLLSTNKITEAVTPIILHGSSGACQTHAQLYFWDESHQSLYQIIASQLWEPLLNQLRQGTCKAYPFGTFPIINYEQIGAWYDAAHYDSAFFLRGMNHTTQTHLETCIRELFDKTEQETQKSSDITILIGICILALLAIAASIYVLVISCRSERLYQPEELQPLITRSNPIANKDAEEQADETKPRLRV